MQFPDFRQEFNDYCNGVLDSSIPACETIKQAVRRHQQDLLRDDIYFDDEAADRVCNFIYLLKHFKGEWLGRPFHLLPYQTFIARVLFGWKLRKNDHRRFRTALIVIPRKSGKSTFLAAIALYMLVADGEAAAECYSAAMKREQASIIWRTAARMARQSEFLRQRLTFSRNNLCDSETFSKFEPLSADEKSLDGLDIHLGLIDETQAHKTRNVYDLVDTATAARRQPLIIAIGTAGQEATEGVLWYDLFKDAEAILAGQVEDDSTFAFITRPDDGDDLTDERTWAKVNPAWDKTVKPDDLRRKHQKALRIPRALVAFRRLHLNVIGCEDAPWLDLRRWRKRACKLVDNVLDVGDKLIKLKGRSCWAGLDLASRFDLNCLSLVFPFGKRLIVVPHFWLPDGVLKQREQKDRQPYRQWVVDGWLATTEGNTVDYNKIQKKIEELSETFDIRGILYDPYSAQQLATNLEAFGLSMIEFPQNIRQYTEPSKLFEQMVASGKVYHTGNPLLDWNMQNVRVKEDQYGAIRPVKPKQGSYKIDGAVATIMACRGLIEDTNKALPGIL